LRVGPKNPLDESLRALFFNGGMGATPVKDGENVRSWPSNIPSMPVEGRTS